MRVAKENTDLRRRKPFSCEFANVLDDILRRCLEPRGGTALVWQRGGRCGESVRLLRECDPHDPQMPFPGACMRPMVYLRTSQAKALQNGSLRLTDCFCLCERRGRVELYS